MIEAITIDVTNTLEVIEKSSSKFFAVREKLSRLNEAIPNRLVICMDSDQLLANCLPITGSDNSSPAYDAILIVGFGGPEKREDVMPFLENVTRGRNIPTERLLEVAEHYDHFGGISPINGQV